MKSLRLPLLLFALPAVLLALLPAGRGLFVLDRTAVADGELWRLWTGHWVHFSASHLIWNLLVLLVAGSWLEHSQPGRLWRHAILAAPFIAASVLAFEPGLRVYGGLSGLAMSVVALLALQQVRSSSAPRIPWLVLLLLLAAKAGHDLTTSVSWFARLDVAGVRTSSVAHAAGLAAAGLHAAVLWGADRLRPAQKLPPGPVTGSRRQGSGCYP
jgi:rhomboid family GlyGly-CTERM serine protease